MRLIIIFIAMLGFMIDTAQALQVKQHMQTTIGLFDACEQILEYSFFNNKDYDVKTAVKTTGTFGVIYPFTANYHAVGTYNQDIFKPQSYFYEAQSRFTHRTKEIIYQDGVPVQRISVKNEKKRYDDIIIDSKYAQSIDLLSMFGKLTEQIVRTGKCDFDDYSFNGKKYTKSTLKQIKKEKIKTKYFEGKAIKCQYFLEVLDDADAGFMLNKDEPIYLWIMRDKQTDAPFVAKVEIASTPFGKLKSVTTKLEVKK